METCGCCSKEKLTQPLNGTLAAREPLETTQIPERTDGRTVASFDSWISSKLYSSISNFPEIRHVLVGLEHSGNGLYVIPAVVLLFLNPWETSPVLRQFWLGVIVALILDLVVIGTVKSIFRRSRPTYNRGMSVIIPADKWSFPSGHASRALMLACLVTMKADVFPLELHIPFLPNAPINRLTAIQIFDTWSISTAASRIFLGRHYFLDVVCGCAVGYLEAVCTLYCLWPPVELSEHLHNIFMHALLTLGLWH